MLVSYNWLSEWCTLPSVDRLIEDLNRIGFEVESIHTKGRDLKKIVVGHITRFEKHPEAKRLRVAQVSIGKKTIQLVTAATNVSEGDRIPVSLPGAVLADDLTITESTLRGVLSQGMMCSAVECGLTESAPGVWVLPPDTPIGVDFIKHAQLIDTILDVAILPNRGDAMSLFGLARDLSALYKKPLPKKIAPPSPNGHPSNVDCRIHHDACTYYRAQRMTGIHNTHTPLHFQTRLYYTGHRPISWIVDVTNIVLVETGQPLHAFDATGITQIDVDTSPDTAISLLNDDTIPLDEDTLTIRVNQTPAAIAGIMGATDFSVTPQTHSIILEAAQFDPHTIRQTVKRLILRSESAMRFEKHGDPAAVNRAIHRCMALFHHYDPHTFAAHDPVECGHLPLEPVTIPFPWPRIRQLLGISITRQRAIRHLNQLGFDVTNDTIAIPCWRIHDCSDWPDIAEEIIRFTAIDTLKPQPLSRMIPITHDPMWTARESLAQTAVAIGFTEVIPFPLNESDPVANQPRVLNPINASLTTLRSSSFESLITIAASNAARHKTPCRLFSIGPVWSPKGDESWVFSALMQGPNHHSPYLPDHHQPIDFYDLRGVIDHLLGTEGLAVEQTEIPTLHPGQTAAIYKNGDRIGVVGMVHPQITQAQNLPATGFMEWTITPTPHVWPQYDVSSRYQGTTRDTTYVVTDTTVPIGRILDILMNNKPLVCHNIVLCGYFTKNDAVHVSFRMTYQAWDDVLDTVVVNGIHEEFSKRVIRELPCRFP